MAVGFDAKMTAGNQTTLETASAASSISSTGMTIGGSATLLIAVLVLGTNATNPTGISMTWNSVSMTAGPSITAGPAARVTATVFYLVNPTTGNKTLAGAWTGAKDAYMSCASFTGTDTTTGVQAADNTTASGTTSIAVPTDSSGATVACFVCDGSTPTITQTTIFAYAALNPGGGASYALGGTTTNTHSFTGAGGSAQALAGVHIIASGGAAFTPRKGLTILQAVNRASTY